MKQLKITPIKNGTVIDHITPGMALHVLKVLKIPDQQKHDVVSIAMNARGKTGLKDIVKIENHELKSDDVDKISLIAPQATINIIRDYNVIEKHHVNLPDEIVGILKCGNPTCISNTNEPVPSRFHKVNTDPLLLRCHYCDRELEYIIESIV